MTKSSRVRVVLVRHGRTDWNARELLQGRTDIPLNDEGRAEIKRAAHALKGERWDALWTSPLTRARQSAQLLGTPLRLSPQVSECLQERDFGVFEGKHREFYLTSRRENDDNLRSMEADVMLQQRSWDCMQGLVVQRGQGSLIVVSHGGFINAFLHKVSSGRIGTGVSKLANGSFTRLLWCAPHQWHIISVNDTTHL